MNEEFHRTVKIFTLDSGQETLIPLIYDSFEKEHIPVQIRSFHDSAYDGLFVGQKGAAAIYVFEEDQERAEDLLNQLLADYDQDK